jgi:HEAT repeat protein
MVWMVVLLLLAGLAHAQGAPDAEIPQLTTQLTTGASDARQKALERLQALNTPKAFETACLALNDANPMVRGKAAGVVARLGGPKATPRLAPLLKDEFVLVRGQTITALGNTRDFAAVDVLLSIAKTPGAEHRDLAVAGLGTLLGALEENATALRKLITALNTLGEDKEPRIAQAARQAVFSALCNGKTSPAKVDALLEILKDASAEQTRFQIINTLTNMRAVRAVPVLIDELVKHPGANAWQFENAIIEILRGQMTPRHAALLAPLRAKFTDPNQSVAFSAMRVVSELRDTASVEPLIALLRDADNNRAALAARALLRMRDPRARAPLCALAGHPEAMARAAAAEALGWVGDTAALTALLPMVADADGNVRTSVAKALGTCVAPAAVTALRGMGRDPEANVRRAVVAGLDGRRDPATIDLLCGLVADPDAGVRVSAVTALGKTGSSAAVTALRPLLEGDDVRLKREATTALARLGDAGGIQAYEKMLIE